MLLKAIALGPHHTSALCTAFLAGILAATSGCSLRSIVVDKAGDALSEGGITYAADDDPELIRDATPFSLKLMESLLAANPRHQGLLLASARGFTQYSYAFVQIDAEQLDSQDLAAANAGRERAKRLYRRARDYGRRGLEVAHPGIDVGLQADPRAALMPTSAKDVPLLYWTAAAWAAHIALALDDPAALADLPIVEAMMDRALVLDEGFDDGAIHTFLISYSMVRPGVSDPVALARSHFTRAIALSHATQAAPYVALAEAVCVAEQQRGEFEALLQQALEVDPDQVPATRLANLVIQRRAAWLLAHGDELFME